MNEEKNGPIEPAIRFNETKDTHSNKMKVSIASISTNVNLFFAHSIVLVLFGYLRQLQARLDRTQ